MAASGGGGGMSGVMKLCIFICIACLLYLGWIWGNIQVQNGRGQTPDVPDRDPCTVRCDRSGDQFVGP